MAAGQQYPTRHKCALTTSQFSSTHVGVISGLIKRSFHALQQAYLYINITFDLCIPLVYQDSFGEKKWLDGVYVTSTTVLFLRLSLVK